MHRLPGISLIIALASLMLAPRPAAAGIDLRNATVDRLENGMTVILLEDRNFPVVSTQMLYRVGARDESYGQTGIAHFLEHMAFRESEHFPGTGLVSSIYAVGGEWHGYTWTDQTTYFSTVPKQELDLLLRIEADRMARLEISADDMEAERGAVLAEMHMYENYPTSMLLDAVLFTSFFAHPYRNNTIGWESDIENLEHEQVVAFYERHYRPANAVLAIVGDFDRDTVRKRVRALFGDIAGGSATPLPHTVEPLQQGVRRVRLLADTEVKRFMIGWRGPSANHPDFAAFLVLQEVLGAGSGVNFRQNDWGTPVDDDAILDGVADDLTTWFPPSAQDYIFIVGGTIATDDEERRLEQAIEVRLGKARREAPDDETLEAAIERVLDELVYDVETTEDAAHQLAFFDGLGALDAYLELPGRVAAVTAADVRRVVNRWLLPERRTIGWHVPDNREERPSLPPLAAAQAAVLDVPSPSPDREPVPAPELLRLSGGVPVILQHSDLSASAYLKVVLPGSHIAGEGVAGNEPVLGHSSFAWRFRPDELQQTVALARQALAHADVDPDHDLNASDPETRLEQEFHALMRGASTSRVPLARAPALLAVAGDLERKATMELLEEAFGGLSPPPAPRSAASELEDGDINVRLGRPVAQAQLGYIVPAPGPRDAQSYAWRILRYILSHDYEGRLGREAISNRGLAYYIDSRYRSDGEDGWITLAVGVDPDKLAALKGLMKAELQRLRDEPPSAEEIDEAKRHFVGRARSASQSNRELAATLSENWLWFGDLPTPAELQRRLQSIGREEVLEAVPGFVEGAIVVVAE